MSFTPGVNHCHGRISSINLASGQAETYHHHWSIPPGCVRPHLGQRCGKKTYAGNSLCFTFCSIVLGTELYTKLFSLWFFPVYSGTVNKIVFIMICLYQDIHRGKAIYLLLYLTHQTSEGQRTAFSPYQIWKVVVHLFLVRCHFGFVESSCIRHHDKELSLQDEWTEKENKFESCRSFCAFLSIIAAGRADSIYTKDNVPLDTTHILLNMLQQEHWKF
jgi:hypothetical protein